MASTTPASLRAALRLGFQPMNSAPEGRWRSTGAQELNESAAPAGAVVIFDLLSGGLHHRLISIVPPAQMVRGLPRNGGAFYCGIGHARITTRSVAGWASSR